MQGLLFNIAEQKRDVVFLCHNTFLLKNTLWKDVFLAESKNPETLDYVVVRKEHIGIDFQFPDTYPIIESFKNIL